MENSKGLVVLSLFDGMACGLAALKRAGIPVRKYYASEIDKHAIQIAMKNHPEIRQIGDVTLWKEWVIEKPDLIIGGSPCQGFSFAGKQLAFDDPRSSLFFTMMDIIKYHNPKYKLLENVRMKKDSLDVITGYMGVDPLFINSALVSAQNRQRHYWFNWDSKLPDDKHIYLKDILEKQLPSCGLGARIVGRRLDALGKRQDYNFNIPIKQYLEIRDDVKANCMTTVYKDSVTPYYKTSKRLNIKFNQKKASCLTGGAHSGGNHSDMDILVIEPDVVRRYSVIEAERLQTLEDGYTEGISNSQRYKMIGNGWTVDVLSHLFKSMC